MSPLSYSIDGAAEATGLSPSHIKREIDAGKLRAKASAFRTDGRVSKYVILAADLEEYLAGLDDVA